MLSFLYRLVRTFQREHGYQPNVVVMNATHYRLLQANLPEIGEHDELGRLLGMEIMLSADCVHPHVAWMPQARRVAVG